MPRSIPRFQPLASRQVWVVSEGGRYSAVVVGTLGDRVVIAWQSGPRRGTLGWELPELIDEPPGEFAAAGTLRPPP